MVTETSTGIRTTLNITVAEKVCFKNLLLQSTQEVIQFEFSIKGALAKVEIFVLCGWRFLNHFDMALETPYRCDTVGCEL